MIQCQHSYYDRNRRVAGYATQDSEFNLVDKHDCRYVDAVDALIPRAAEIAQRETELEFKLEPNASIIGRAEKEFWDRSYHQAMGALAREAGIRS